MFIKVNKSQGTTKFQTVTNNRFSSQATASAVIVDPQEGLKEYASTEKSLYTCSFYIQPQQTGKRENIA